MFDFQKLDVYKKAKDQHSKVVIIANNIDNKVIKDQFSRASLSILLNIAEGTGRFTNPDKRNFYIIARGSVFECVALIEILFESNLISPHMYNDYFNSYEDISKMLYGLIKSLK